MPLGFERAKFRPNRFPSMPLVAPAVAIGKFVAALSIKANADPGEQLGSGHV